MCSIVISFKHCKDYPLIVAHNRDERIDRPTSCVQLLNDNPAIIGAKDELKGGTWLGVNEHNLFVAVTNQGRSRKRLTSRGLLVLSLLKNTSLDNLINAVDSINPSDYNQFNLVFGNQDKVFLAHSYILPFMAVSELRPGTHLIESDYAFGKADNIKSIFMHQTLSPAIARHPEDYYQRIKSILATSEYGFKKKTRKNKDGEDVGMPTQSSSIVLFSSKGLDKYKYFDRTKEVKHKTNGKVVRYIDFASLLKDKRKENKAREELVNKLTQICQVKVNCAIQ